jgi:hypothetical protein
MSLRFGARRARGLVARRALRTMVAYAPKVRFIRPADAGLPPLFDPLMFHRAGKVRFLLEVHRR